MISLEVGIAPQITPSLVFLIPAIAGRQNRG